MWAPDPPPSRRPSISMMLAILFASTTFYLLFFSTHAPNADQPNGIQAQQDNFQSSSLSPSPRSTLLQHDPDTDVIPTIPVSLSNAPQSDAPRTPTPTPAAHGHDDDDDKDKKNKSTHNELDDHDQEEKHDKEKDKDKDKDTNKDKDKDKENNRKKKDDHDDDEADKKDKKKNKKKKHDDEEDDHDDDKDKKDKKNKKNKDGKKDQNKNKKPAHNDDDDHDDDKDKKDNKRNGNKDVIKINVNQPYRILLIGDSITYGTGPNPVHPYSIQLQQKFDKHGIKVEINNQGINSNFVVQDPWQTAMIDRLPHFLAIDPQNNTSLDKSKTKQTPPTKYDMVIILGGTNDLSYCISPFDTLAGLISMHERVRANGAITVALTVPERSNEIVVEPPYQYQKTGKQGAGGIPGSQLYSRRMIINQGLETYCQQHAPSKKHGVTATGEMPCLLVDFAHEIPYKKQKFWIDAVHPSSAGYDLLGEIIWDVIEPYVDS